MEQRAVVVVLVAVIACAAACGATTDPTPAADAGADADAASGDDAGLAPIACGSLMCAGAKPYCLMTHVCGYGLADCTFPTSDGGTCPEAYIACDGNSGKPGCLSAYGYSCEANPTCEQIGPRTYGNCNC